MEKYFSNSDRFPKRKIKIHSKNTVNKMNNSVFYSSTVTKHTEQLQRKTIPFTQVLPVTTLHIQSDPLSLTRLVFI